MRELWIGVVEVLTEPTSEGSDTRAFTNVVTWADNPASYVESVKAVLGKYGWTVLGVENAGPIHNREGFDDEISEIIGRARLNPNACIYSRFHYYPSRPT